MVISFSAAFVLEVSAIVSLKVATTGSFRGKKTEIFAFFQAIFVKQKR